LAIPALGCGNGGLNWNEIRPLMCEDLSKLNIPVEIYTPD
jgi:O-acetyl-ADP-ribose deacetylase (regulator of RNase III)